MATRINFIDIYSFYDEIDSYMIESLMDDRDISFSIRTLGPSAQAFDARSLEMRVAVEEGKVEYALRLLSDAIRSGVISREGKFRI
jgi:hypothetical protein